MPRYGYAIDLRRCSGCGACALACKGENNVPDGFFWAHYLTETVGVFPNVRYSYMPTMCNHCENAPCVHICPVEPKAMYKTPEGLTLHAADRCIGCRKCTLACPYGVISFNSQEVHSFWRGDTALIAGGTSTLVERNAEVGGEVLPYSNPDRGRTYPVIRPRGITEKCTGCDHRIAEGLLPRCVETCPADARTFGDLDDPTSEVSRMVADPTARVLKPDLGTRPRVFYVGTFNPG